MSQRIPFWTPYAKLAKVQLTPLLTRSAGRIKFNGRISAFHPASPSFKFGESSGTEDLLKGQFSYCGQKLDVGLQGDPWTVAVPSIEFATWLHGFEWLPDLLSSKNGAGHTRAVNYVDSWIITYGKWNDFSWQANILAQRLFNWLALWSPALADSDDNPVGRRRRGSVYRDFIGVRYAFTRPRG